MRHQQSRLVQRTAPPKSTARSCGPHRGTPRCLHRPRRFFYPWRKALVACGKFWNAAAHRKKNKNSRSRQFPCCIDCNTCGHLLKSATRALSIVPNCQFPRLHFNAVWHTKSTSGSSPFAASLSSSHLKRTKDNLDRLSGVKALAFQVSGCRG